MPKFPYTLNLTTGREYYGPSLGDPKRQPDMWTTRPPSGFYEDQHPTSDLWWIAGGTAALFASGYIPFGKGRLWDKYVTGIRAFEEYSPAGIFRTFQASTFLSQFTSQARQAFHFTPELPYASYLAKLAGETVEGNIHQRILHEGVTFRGGKAYFGKTTDVLLERASVLISPTAAKLDITKWVGGELGSVAGKHYGSAYARSAGVQLKPELYGLGKHDARLFGDIFQTTEGEFHRQIIGGQGRLQHMGRQIGGWGTEFVSRFNRLLEQPFQVPPISTVFEKTQEILKKLTGERIKFAVEHGSGLQMLGKLAAKYGLAATGITLGYKTVDWTLRTSEALEGTVLGTGITGTLGTGVVQANLLASRAADLFGLHSYREAQEELAPGSTELSRLLAIPFMGALGATGIGYAAQVKRMAQLQVEEGIGSAAARSTVAAELASWGDEGILSRIGKTVASKEGLYSRQDWIGKAMKSIAHPVSRETGELTYKVLGKMTPIKLGALAGAGVGLALIAPFLPGALIPSERPEELEAIYSGEKEVPIRKGRWWELGRCLIKSNTYTLINGETRTSDQIQVGDKLIGSDFDTARVKQIYTRHHIGEVRKFYTAHDRDIYTGLTENHIVPVLRNGEEIEVEAKDIQLNEYVRVPVFWLDHNVSSLDTTEIIRTPVIVGDGRVFATQRNWYTGKLQKSGKSSIPSKIDLDYDLGLLFGYFLAEGNISFNKGNPTIIETVHAKSEYNYVLDIKRIVSEKFGIQPTVRFKDTGERSKEGCWIVRICCAVLARFFRYLFYNEKYSSHDKFIPIQLIYATRDFQSGLIEGYWRGDGHLDHTSKVITSARKWLLTTVQLIALDHGIPCGISRHHEGKKHKSWRLRFYHPNATNPGSKFVNGRLYTRIRKIEIEEYNDIVYDFEVDHPDHLLQAGTFLVHNSPWEGKRIKYFRPHWYPRMLMRAKDRAIWGDEEPSPLEKLYTKEFTYDLEKRDYWDRPYPVTSLPFEDIPFIGPVLAATVGRLIKPEVLMHTEEWMSPTGEIKAMPPGFGERRAVELGEQPPPTPISPFSLKGTTGEQAYRLTEMIGLPGFTMTAIKESITGTPDLYDQMMQLESARRAYGFEREYWDLEIGGGLGTTEFFRRLYPHRRRQIPRYNPIRNTMPEWLPGPGEKSPDFQHGDPWTKVEEGELRLPGKGYEARFPELEGLTPDEYPLIHRYKILADVAPYSDKYKLVLQQIRSQRKLADWSEYEEEIYNTTQEQVQQRKIKKEFDEYEYLSPMGDIFGESRTYADESSDLLATLNRMRASEEKEPGVITRLFGGYWELLSHNAETALDTMTPLSPGAKLVHQRTALEDYHNTMVYGTENAFWSHPIRDFIKPMLTRSAAAMGFDGIPDHVKERRSLTEYFDILKYVKYSRLSNIARMSNDTKAVREFESKKNETLFGINPFTYNYSHIFRALPRSERDYFNSFAAADTTEERAKILQMVPDNERGLYVARWKLQFKEDIEKAREAGYLSAEQEAEADVQIEQIDSEARSEGMPTSKELFAEYISTKMSGESYGDWYRRTKLLPEIPLPGPDWVGFHPSVDLEDVKLKLVQSMGEDMHEYDLWPSRAQSLVNKPYINREAIAPFLEPEDMSEDEMRARVDSLLATTGGKSQMFFRTSFGGKPSDMVDIEQDVNMKAALEKML